MLTLAHTISSEKSARTRNYTRELKRCWCFSLSCSHTHSHAAYTNSRRPPAAKHKTRCREWIFVYNSLWCLACYFLVFYSWAATAQKGGCDLQVQFPHKSHFETRSATEVVEPRRRKVGKRKVLANFFRVDAVLVALEMHKKLLRPLSVSCLPLRAPNLPH